MAEVVVGYGRIARKSMMEFGRVGTCVPARVAPKGRIHRSSPAHNACIFGMETPLRGRSGGQTGTAPTVLFGGLRVGGFVCWLVGESGAHEPTPSVLYFCQPRVADDRRLPWVKSWRGTYAIGIVLFKINLHAGNHSFAACGNDV